MTRTELRRRIRLEVVEILRRRATEIPVKEDWPEGVRAFVTAGINQVADELQMSTHVVWMGFKRLQEERKKSYPRTADFKDALDEAHERLIRLGYITREGECNHDREDEDDNRNEDDR